MKSVVYLILALICFYYLLDDFFGKNKISNWVNNFIGDFGGIAAPPAKTDTQTQTSGSGATETATQAATATAKQTDTGKILIPQPQPDPGKMLIPQPQGNQTWNTKPAKNGTWNPFPNLSFPNIFGVPAVVPEIVGGVGSLLTFPQRLAQGGF